MILFSDIAAASFTIDTLRHTADTILHLFQPRFFAADFTMTL